jgi:hypothetical protein
MAAFNRTLPLSIFCLPLRHISGWRYRLKLNESWTDSLLLARPDGQYGHRSDASATLVFCVASLDEKKLELESLGYKFIHSGENEDSKYAAFWGPSEIVHEISEAAKKP